MPPVAGISRSPVAPGPAKTITSSARQVAPAGVPGTAQTMRGVVPSLSMLVFLRTPFAKNQIDKPSGAKNG